MFYPLKHGSNGIPLIRVEAKIQEECGDTAYTIIIEDKYCAKLTDAQLEKYKETCVRNKIDTQYFVIRLEQDDKYGKSDEEICKNCGYTSCAGPI